MDHWRSPENPAQGSAHALSSPCPPARLPGAETRATRRPGNIPKGLPLKDIMPGILAGRGTDYVVSRSHRDPMVGIG